MGSKKELSCPVSGCSFDGTVSQVIHHITGQDDTEHTWEALEFQNSWQFRNAHTGKSNSKTEDTTPNGAKSNESRTHTAEEISLEEVPGIGSTRAAALRKAGYECAADIAEASISELSQTSNVTDVTARCIRLTAKEECGYQDTFIAQLSDELSADRDKLADAYADLAATLVTPEEAEDTLKRLVDQDGEQSVVHLTDYSLRYRHYLLQTGFESIRDVTQASTEELTEAPYVGEGLAQNLRENVRERLNESSATRNTDSDVEDNPDEKIHQRSSADQSGDGGKDQEGGSRKGDGNDGTKTSGGSHQASGSAADGKSAGMKKNNDSSISIAEPVDGEEFPEEMIHRDQWLLWKQTDDDQKIPRAPWETGDPLQYVSAMDPANWTSFHEAKRWRSKLSVDLNLAYAITRDDEIVFFDLDDVIRDSELSRAARDLIEEAGSYAAISTSGTGVHIFARGSLSDGVKSLTGPLDEAGEQTLEVYDRNRFIAMTGDHLDGTPRQLTATDLLLDRLEDEFASVGSETPDRVTVEPQRSRDELRELETTSDIQDVFDAINQTRPADITMRSTQTREHGDGTYSYDPSWVHSESGTRLGVLEDVWIYRKGMVALNALQVVALEEGIITNERDYPEGEAFWKAVEALRDRGAHIPHFEPDGEPVDETAASETDGEINKWEVAKRINYGDCVRTHVHPYDRDYQERLALDLAPVLVETAESLHLSQVVTYRAAELYVIGHKAGIVPGAAHECSLGAALRIASIEAGTPRPLADIADAIGERPKTIRQKFHRMVQETTISDTFDASDLIVEPSEYVPYMARQLELGDDEALCNLVRDLLEEAELDGGSNPMSEAAAAFYVALKRSHEHASVTQRQVADAAGLTEVTIRNNYRKFTLSNL